MSCKHMVKIQWFAKETNSTTANTLHKGQKQRMWLQCIHRKRMRKNCFCKVQLPHGTKVWTTWQMRVALRCCWFVVRLPKRLCSTTIYLRCAQTNFNTKVQAVVSIEGMWRLTKSKPRLCKTTCIQNNCKLCSCPRELEHQFWSCHTLQECDMSMRWTKIQTGMTSGCADAPQP